MITTMVISMFRTVTRFKSEATFCGLLLFSCSLFLSGEAFSGIDEAWQNYSRPERMRENFKVKFSMLPLQGRVSDAKKYWSSDYWPLFKGSINYRWNSTTPSGFNLKSPTLKQAKKLPITELMALSPAEKYDLYTGKYSYPLKARVAKRASPRRREWEGMCHGWASAALNHSEPTPKILTNPHGLLVPFGSSDIKALVSYYYAYHYSPSSTHQMGRRCDGTNHCQNDLNAGAFHIVLSNTLGLEGSSFIADIENGREVWNQVAHHYQSKIVQKRIKPTATSAPGTTEVLRMKTKFTVVFNIVRNSWTPVIGTELQTYKDLEFEYLLELNREGEIIGGEWLSTVRPDFLWFVAKTKKFDTTFSKLGDLLEL